MPQWARLPDTNKGLLGNSLEPLLMLPAQLYASVLNHYSQSVLNILGGVLKVRYCVLFAAHMMGMYRASSTRWSGFSLPVD